MIYPCGSSGGASGGTIQGRTGADVARITAEFNDGARVEATVGNGFFLLVLPRPAAELDALMARDASGRVLARLEAGAPGTVLAALARGRG